MDVPASYLPSNAAVLTLGCRKAAARRSEVARECEDGECAWGEAGGWWRRKGKSKVSEVVREEVKVKRSWEGPDIPWKLGIRQLQLRPCTLIRCLTCASRSPSCPDWGKRDGSINIFRKQ